MSEDDTRVDQEGNVYKKNWAGQYEQQWDTWRQQPARDDSEREGRPDSHSWDGTPLYNRRETSSGSSGSGGDGGAALIGLAFLLIPLLIKGAGWVFSELGKPATTVSTQGKSPLAAGLLSFFLWGGVGHIYLGQKKKGIVFVGSTLLAFLVLGPLGWLVQIVGAIDAYGTANKLQNGQSVEEWEFGLGEEAKNAYIALGALVAIGIALYMCASASGGPR